MDLMVVKGGLCCGSSVQQHSNTSINALLIPSPPSESRGGLSNVDPPFFTRAIISDRKRK